MNRSILFAMIVLIAAGVLWAASAKDKTGKTSKTDKKKGAAVSDKVQMTDAEWKKILSPEQYEILRKKGTERAFTGKYTDHHETGSYVCAGCGFKLFVSEDKFDSHCGWPSFSKPVSADSVASQEDNSHFMKRVEVLCPKCGGHLGHVFEDGPKPTGLRYCINSASLEFKPADEKTKK